MDGMELNVLGLLKTRNPACSIAYAIMFSIGRTAHLITLGNNNLKQH